jgi:DNA-binding LacI/PurR family transcriptional regulator
MVSTRYRYQVILEAIKSRIESGQYPQGRKILSSRDLAKEFRTTVLTVNKALDSLVEMGFIRKEAKRGSFVNDTSLWNRGKDLASRSGLICAMISDTSASQYWGRILKGIGDALNQKGLHLVVANNGGDFSKAMQSIEQLEQRGIEGFVFAPIAARTIAEYECENLKLLDRLDSLRIPYVLIARRVAAKACSVVTSHNYEEGTALMERLLSSGVREPMCITQWYASSYADRERAFCDALKKRGFRDAEERVYRLTTDDMVPPALDDLRAILESRPEADGVYSVNGLVLSGILRLMAGNPTVGKRELRLVAFNELEPFPTNAAVLMTENQPAYEMGWLAGRTIVDKLGVFRDLTIDVYVSSRPTRERSASR